MIVTVVNIYVKEEFIKAFIAATIENHECSIKEKGNVRFDFLQSESDHCRFTLYEVYESEESAAAHKLTPHYNKWRETVQDMMAKPREGIKHKVIRPIDKNLW